MKRLIVTVCISFALLAAVGLNVSWAETENKIIRAKGAHTLANSVQRLGDAYVRLRPTVTVVSSGGGSTTGIDAWLKKEVELALCVRQLNHNEIKKAEAVGMKPVHSVVAHDGVAIIANPANGISELTVDQVSKIFTGEYADWKDVGGPDAPIHVWITDPAKHGTPGFFRRTFLRDKPYGKDVKLRAQWYRLIADVAKDKNAFAFCLTKKALDAAREGKVKLISVKSGGDTPAVKISWETIADGSYPLRRPVYFYWDGKSASADLHKFMDFCADKGVDLRGVIGSKSSSPAAAARSMRSESRPTTD